MAALICLHGSLYAQAPAKPQQARSVHLRYQAPKSAVFYNEVTVKESVPGSYFMVCGFRQGYYGIQERPTGRKRLLFSVWDPGNEDSLDTVPADQRVEVVYNAGDVMVRRFGGEGTGGQSFFEYDWKIGETYRLMVQAKVEGHKTSFAAWFFLNDTGVWKHLATFRTITGGTPLSDFYSFIEDYRRDGKSLEERRSALFGNGWVRGTDGRWASLTEARFTADRTPVDNVDAGVQGCEFYLATGGNTVKHTELQSTVRRRPGSQQPPQLP
jgi:hypothetical protein